MLSKVVINRPVIKRPVIKGPRTLKVRRHSLKTVLPLDWYQWMFFGFNGHCIPCTDSKGDQVSVWTRPNLVITQRETTPMNSAKFVQETFASSSICCFILGSRTVNVISKHCCFSVQLKDRFTLLRPMLSASFIHWRYFYSASLSPLYYSKVLPIQRVYCVAVSRRSATGNLEWRTCQCQRSLRGG